MRARCTIVMTIITTSALTFLMLLATPTGAAAWDRGTVERFATLPPGEKHPEGIEVDQDGTVYVATTAVNKADMSAGMLFVFDSQGKLLRHVYIAGSTKLLLDVRLQDTGERLPLGARHSRDPRLSGLHLRVTCAEKPDRIAKATGAYVATTATGDDLEYIRELGADQVIDYKNESFETKLKEMMPYSIQSGARRP